MKSKKIRRCSEQSDARNRCHGHCVICHTPSIQVVAQVWLILPTTAWAFVEWRPKHLGIVRTTGLRHRWRRAEDYHDFIIISTDFVVDLLFMMTWVVTFDIPLAELMKFLHVTSRFLFQQHGAWNKIRRPQNDTHSSGSNFGLFLTTVCKTRN